MRCIRIVVAISDEMGPVDRAIDPRDRVSGKSLTLDFESTGFVEPGYVIG